MSGPTDLSHSIASVCARLSLILQSRQFIGYHEEKMAE